MNKKQQLGVVLSNINGYKIRTIVNSKRQDTGYIGLFAGKVLVSKSLLNNSKNHGELVHIAVDASTPKVRWVKGKSGKYTITYNLRKKCDIYTVKGKHSNELMYHGKDKHKAIKLAKRYA